MRWMCPLFKDVYYYAGSGHECDFVVCDRRKVESLIQVPNDMCPQDVKARDWRCGSRRKGDRTQRGDDHNLLGT